MASGHRPIGEVQGWGTGRFPILISTVANVAGELGTGLWLVRSAKKNVNASVYVN